MEIVLIIVIGFILYFVIANFWNVIKSNKKFLYHYDELLNDILNVSVKRETLKEYDFSFMYDKKNYVFKILKCPSNAEIVINNKTTWQLNLGMRTGKAPKNKMLVKSIQPFMEFEKENTIKICLIYKDCYSIKRWVNESEMVFVNTNEPCLGIQFLKYDEFEEFIKNIKKA